MLIEIIPLALARNNKNCFIVVLHQKFSLLCKENKLLLKEKNNNLNILIAERLAKMKKNKQINLKCKTLETPDFINHQVEYVENILVF